MIGQPADNHCDVSEWSQLIIVQVFVGVFIQFSRTILTVDERKHQYDFKK